MNSSFRIAEAEFLLGQRRTTEMKTKCRVYERLSMFICLQNEGRRELLIAVMKVLDRILERSGDILDEIYQDTCIKSRWRIPRDERINSNMINYDQKMKL